MTIRKPLVIEFTGPPNSGKTTLVNFLQSTLSNLGYSVETKQEDAEIVPKAIPKKTWARNIWITLGQLQSLIETKYSTADVILLDRGYYDALFWASFLEIQEICSQKDCLSLINLLETLEHQFNFKPDHLFIIDVSTEVSLKRRYAMQSGDSVVLSTDSFIDLYKEHLKDFCKKVPDGTTLFQLDTSNLTFSEMHKVILDRILNIIKN